MNFLRIKQAQCALADGRLDEAHDLLKHDAVRSHRTGQALATRLIAALVGRGQLHLGAGRLHDAMADCEKAASLDHHFPGVAELRQQVLDRMAAMRREADRRDHTLDAARQHAREGFLSKGLAMLRGVDDDGGAVAQAQEAMELHRARTDAAIARAESALSREDWTAAGHHLAEARRLRPFDHRIDALTGRFTEEAVVRARQAAEGGRVDTATALLRAIAPIADDRLTVRELREVIEQVTLATSALRSGDARLAARGLRKARTLLPEARWVDEAIDLADRIAASRDALEVGPLGLVPDVAVWNRSTTTHEAETVTTFAYHHADGRHIQGRHEILPSQFILQVDGQSGSLVTCDDKISIGPVSSSDRPTVGLLTEPDAPTITIRRAQDDYFLQCATAINVNGKPTRERLLADGDKIELSPRCRFRFRLPHAASTTAVVELTGARLVRGDLRRIVLLDRQIVIGAGPACHVKADGAEPPVILCMREGELFCQSSREVTIGGDVHDATQALPMNRAVVAGEVSMRLMAA